MGLISAVGSCVVGSLLIELWDAKNSSVLTADHISMAQKQPLSVIDNVTPRTAWPRCQEEGHAHLFLLEGHTLLGSVVTFLLHVLSCVCLESMSELTKGKSHPPVLESCDIKVIMAAKQCYFYLFVTPVHRWSMLGCAEVCVLLTQRCRYDNRQIQTFNPS